MTDKIAFCREWYERGECPGCGSPLEDVAGQNVGHGVNGTVRNSGGNIGPGLCGWTSDDLTSLVLIGSGHLHSLRDVVGSRD